MKPSLASPAAVSEVEEYGAIKREHTCIVTGM